MSKNLCGKEIRNEGILMIEPESVLRCLRTLAIPELMSVLSLNLLNGDYINLECLLPNGATGKILDDEKTYYVNQVEKYGSDRCYGVAADEQQIAVFEYGCNGTDAVLVAWLRYQPEYCSISKPMVSE